MDYQKAKITIIGGGHMGWAIAEIFTQNGCQEVVRIVEINIRLREKLTAKKFDKIRLFTQAEDCLSDCDLLIIAVKPQSLANLYLQIKGRIKEQTVVISIAAGIRLESLIQNLKHKKVIRAMPNTPAQIGSGVTVWIAGSELNSDDLDLVKNVFDLWGSQLQVFQEKLLDVATAVFGTGPAYVCLIVESIVEAAILIGFDWIQVKHLVLEMIYGSLKLIEKNLDTHVAQLRDNVTSPDGTTAEALFIFDQRGFKAIIKEAIKAAFEKCLKLGS